ncbi:hypothetical protein [Kamptonema sp. UHCC 0994]|nr:hypothetical protein [Kamptonema sp. UHCC 0994]
MVDDIKDLFEKVNGKCVNNIGLRHYLRNAALWAVKEPPGWRRYG